MSIRNYLVLALSLAAVTPIFSAEQPSKEWKQFKRTHDLLVLIKNTKKNEDRVVKFSLNDLSEEEYQVNWIEREDFLSKDVTWASLELSDKNLQCFSYEQKVGAEDERHTMLTLQIPEPWNKQYMFIMNDYYKCVSAVTVPNKLAQEKPTAKPKPVTAKEKAQHYLGKIKQNIALAWSKLSGKKK